MTPRTAARIDGNHAEIREAARAAGYEWYDTFRLGRGFPDALVVSKSGIPVLVEIKTSDGEYTAAEERFCNGYSGPYALVVSADELLLAMYKWDEHQLIRDWY